MRWIVTILAMCTTLWLSQVQGHESIEDNGVTYTVVPFLELGGKIGKMEVEDSDSDHPLMCMEEIVVMNSPKHMQEEVRRMAISCLFEIDGSIKKEVVAMFYIPNDST